MPGDYCQDGDIEGEVEDAHEGDGEQDGAGDGAGGVRDFAAEEGDVVVAPEVVGGDEHGAGEAGEEGGGEVEGSGREGEGLGEVALGEGYGEGSRAMVARTVVQRDVGDPAQAGEVAVEEQDGQGDGCDGNEGCGAEGEASQVQPGGMQRWGQVGGVLREADGAAGD